MAILAQDTNKLVDALYNHQHFNGDSSLLSFGINRKLTMPEISLMAGRMPDKDCSYSSNNIVYEFETKNSEYDDVHFISYIALYLYEYAEVMESFEIKEEIYNYPPTFRYDFTDLSIIKDFIKNKAAKVIQKYWKRSLNSVDTGDK